MFCSAWQNRHLQSLFMRISQVFVFCLSEGNSWNNISVIVSFGHMEAVQHWWPTFFFFFVVCPGLIVWNILGFDSSPYSSDIESAMLFARGLFSLACMQLPVFFWNRSIWSCRIGLKLWSDNINWISYITTYVFALNMVTSNRAQVKQLLLPCFSWWQIVRSQNWGRRP